MSTTRAGHGFRMAVAMTIALLLAAPARAGTVFLISGGDATRWETLVRTHAHRIATDLPGRLGAGLPDSVRIVLCASGEEFRRYSRGSAGDRVLGVAHAGAGLLALNVPQLMPGPRRSLIGTLRHELAHLALATTGAALPLWFEEGVASWFAGRFTELGPLSAPALTGADWLALDRLAVSFPGPAERRALAYAKSVLAIERLELARSGAVAKIVGLVSRGQSFEAAFEEVAGHGIDRLDRMTREATRRRWFRELWTGNWAVPYALLALLSIAVFVIRRRRLGRVLAGEEE